MLEKVTVIDQREVLEDGTIQVRRATYVLEDGVRISAPIYHRVAYTPGANIDHEDAKVKRVAALEWTPDVVTAYKAREAAREAERERRMRGGPPA